MIHIPDILILIPAIIASMTLGAIGRRIAGGLLNQLAGDVDGVSRVMGDTPARAIYAAVLGLCALMGGAAWWIALAMIPAVWVGTTTGNFESMAMGRAQTTFRHDFLGMSAHGALAGVLPVGVAVWGGCGWSAVWIGATCLACAPLYALGWFAAEKIGTQAVPAAGVPRRSGLVGFNGGS
jgi:hypothetical protein